MDRHPDPALAGEGSRQTINNPGILHGTCPDFYRRAQDDESIFSSP